MHKKLIFTCTLLLAAAIFSPLRASTLSFAFAGSGVSGTVSLTYGPGTDSKYPQALEITAVSGTFSDSNGGLNIVNTPILGLVAINVAIPDADNLLAPHDFSRYPVLNSDHGSLSYDNLYWPGGSPQTASDYPLRGGIFDIYGLMFSISGNRVVNLWSNGDPVGSGQGAIYGVAVANQADVLDYVSGVSAVPEPGTLLVLGSGLLSLLALKRGILNRS